MSIIVGKGISQTLRACLSEIEEVPVAQESFELKGGDYEH